MTDLSVNNASYSVKPRMTHYPNTFIILKDRYMPKADAVETMPIKSENLISSYGMLYDHYFLLYSLLFIMACQI